MKHLMAITTIMIMTSFAGITQDSIHVKNNLKIAHSGGTDKCGCHYNRSTGEYHCHTRKQRGGDCPA